MTLRTIRKILTQCLGGLAALMLLSLAGGLQAREMVSIAKPEVNMRTGAGTHYPAVWRLDHGYPLEVLQTQGNWLKVRDFEKDVGWVYRPLVSKAAYVIVKSRVANVRQAPNLSARVLDKVAYGEVMRQLERRNGWVKVQRKGALKGWIARRLLWGQ